MDTSHDLIHSLEQEPVLDHPDDDEELIINLEDDFETIDHREVYSSMIQKKSNKKSLPVLTKYERARLIGIRAQQLAGGAPAVVEVPKIMDTAIQIAEYELYCRKIPLILRRRFPDGTFEDWQIDEFINIR